MRFLLAASLFATVGGCATTHDDKAKATADASFADRATDPRYHRAPPAPPPVNVVRSTESGPSGMAAGGRWR